MASGKQGEDEGLEEGLALRVRIFVRDLLAFSSDEGARVRLLAADPTPDLFYMSPPYFSREEAIRLLGSSPCQRSGSGSGRRRWGEEEEGPQHLTLRQALQDMAQRKAQKGELHLCTSHDLAPLIQDWFGVRKGFQEDPSFKKDLKRFLKQKPKPKPTPR